MWLGSCVVRLSGRIPFNLVWIEVGDAVVRDVAYDCILGITTVLYNLPKREVDSRSLIRLIPKNFMRIKSLEVT